MALKPAATMAGSNRQSFLEGASLQGSPAKAGKALSVCRQLRAPTRADSTSNRTSNVMALSRARAGLPPRPVTEQSDSLMAKVKAAWSIFFPPKPERVSAKEAGKSRLRMILVADRCGMNQASMFEMRHSIVKAVSDFVEIEGEDNVEVNISTEPELGTVYSVAVPVRADKELGLGVGRKFSLSTLVNRVAPIAVPCRRVKAQARFGSEEEDGTTIMFDADGEDQADRFPYGC